MPLAAENDVVVVLLVMLLASSACRGQSYAGEPCRQCSPCRWPGAGLFASR